MYDVAVIGGGPAGSQIAYRLSGMGYAVILIEQKKRIDEPVCCTGIISLECAESFSIDKSIIYRLADRARIISPSGKVLEVRRKQPIACIVDRAALNKFLAERAEKQGAEYLINSKVDSIHVEKDSVKLSITVAGGDTAVIEARAGVIAAGSNNRLFDRQNREEFNDAVDGVQVEVETNDTDKVEVYLGSSLAPGFFAWLVPTLPGKALAGLMSRNKSGYYMKKLLKFLADQKKVVSNEARMSYGRIPLKPLSRTYGNRLLVIGSAAGQVKPTTGGGIYYSMLCADIAARNLYLALEKDDLSAGNLAKYEKEWKEKLDRELMIGYWGRMLYEKLSDNRLDKIIDIIQSKGIDKTLLEADDLSFDWHSGSVLKLIGNRALDKITNVIKIPFPSTERN